MGDIIQLRILRIINIMVSQFILILNMIRTEYIQALQLNIIINYIYSIQVMLSMMEIMIIF